MKVKFVFALLIGEAETEDKVIQIAESYKNCPYVYFMSTKGKKLYAIYYLPLQQKWWIKFIEKKPQDTFGLEKAQVLFFDFIQYPDKLYLRVPIKPKKVSPCGDDCGTCSSSKRCICCPATIYYKL
ncbi:MAG: hypothetical protein ACFE94_04715 [Candidatus Hodarchaeota archaeon]